MPKNRPLPRAAYIRTPAVNADGKISGWDLEPGTVPPQALSVQSLSAITADLGICTSGTLKAGAPHGARVVVGDEANGIVAYNDLEQPFFSLSWLNESLRIGRPDRPGVRIRDGNVEIDGNAVVDGTLTAAKLIAGEIATRLIDTDKLFIGTGDPEASPLAISGFLADATRIGGYKAGVAVWGVNLATGKIACYSTAGTHDYITIGGDDMALVNSYVTGSMMQSNVKLIFRTDTYEESGGVWESAGQHSVTMFGFQSDLFLYSDRALVYPSLYLQNVNGQMGAYLSAGILQLAAQSQNANVTLEHEYGVTALRSDLELALRSQGQDSELRLADRRCELRYQTLDFRPHADYGWLAPGDVGMQEGRVLWLSDGIQKVLAFCDGESWKTLAVGGQVSALHGVQGLEGARPLVDAEDIGLMRDFFGGAA